MGIFDSITALFSRSGKGTKKRTKGKAQTGKKAPQKSPEGVDSIKLAGKPKGRKKTKQVKADPIDETALGFSISLKDSDKNSKKRSSIRVRVKGLVIRVPRLKKIIKVTDISATGLGFPFEKPRIKGGVKLKVDLVLNKKIVAKEIVCKVMHHEKGLVGCRFEELDRAQDDAVCKMVLLGQKQLAERKKAKKDAEFKVPE